MIANIEWVAGDVAIGVAGWLLTYALHSTILLGGAALLTRLVRSDAWQETIWKAALVGGVITATLHAGFGLQPLAGEWRLPVAAVSEATSIASRPALETPAASVEGTAAGSASAAVRGVRSGAAGVPVADGIASAAGRSPADPLRAKVSESLVGQYGTGTTAGAGLSGARERVGVGSSFWLWAFVALWAAGGLLFLARLVWRQFRLQRLLRDRNPVTEGSALSALAALRRNAGVWRPVQLTASGACPGPLALGTAEICVPDRFLRDLDPEQQRSALAHELAHLARRDPAWHLLAGAFEAIFFFQPLNRAARLRLRETAENLCDDWAVRQTGSALGLARCLAEVASWVGRGVEPVPSGTMAMAEGGSPLLRRVERLLSERDAAAPRGLRLRSAAAVAVVLAVSAAAPTVSAGGALAPDAGEPREEAEVPETSLAGGAGEEARFGNPAEPRVEPPFPAIALAPDRSAMDQEPTWGHVQESVIRHPAPGQPLEQRWAWARREAESRGHSDYWVAYSFERLLPADARYVDDSGRWSTAELGGPALGTLVFGSSYRRPEPGSDPVLQPVLVLLHLSDRRAPSPRVDRVSVRNASVGMYLRGDPFYWLGTAADAESFDWLSGQLDELDRSRLRAAVVEAIVLHEDERVMPFLAEIVRSDRRDRVREEAVEGLIWHPGEQSIALLQATALEDPSEDIREEAVETLGEIGVPQAVAALTEIVRSGAPRGVREEALEALATRQSPAALETLAAVVFEDQERGMQEEAAEAIAGFPASSAVPVLERIARTHPDVEVRSEAVEALGEVDPAAAAGVLEALLTSDAPAEVRDEAMHVVAEAGSPRALEAIFQVAMSDPDPDLQEEAVEKLAEFEAAAALPRLEQLVWEHPALPVREEAVETLAELPAELALPVLDQVVASHTDVQVVDQAIEAIGEFPSELSVPRLLRIVREHPDPEAREEALDQLGDRMG